MTQVRCTICHKSFERGRSYSNHLARSPCYPQGPPRTSRPSHRPSRQHTASRAARRESYSTTLPAQHPPRKSERTFNSPRERSLSQERPTKRRRTSWQSREAARVEGTVGRGQGRDEGMDIDEKDEEGEDSPEGAEEDPGDASPTPPRNRSLISPSKEPAGTIEIHYHSSSGLSPIIVRPSTSIPDPSFVDLRPAPPRSITHSSSHKLPPSSYGPLPCSPYSSLIDFDLSELPVRAHLSKKHTDTYYRKFRNLETPPPMGIKSSHMLKKLLKKNIPNKFVPISVSTDIGGKQITVKVYKRDVGSYCRELCEDVYLAGKIRFDAEEWYYHTGKKRVRSYGEPFSGSDADRVQSKMHEGEQPLLLTLFSDETNASSFSGSQQLYPAILWCGSVPQYARKRGTMGAPQVIALYPILESALFSHIPVLAEQERAKFDLFRKARIVVLDDFRKVMSAAIVVQDPLGFNRRIRPVLHTLSWDYKEACADLYLRLNHACVTCFEPKQNWGNLLVEVKEKRTTTSQRRVYNEIKAIQNLGKREEVAKKNGVKGNLISPYCDLPLAFSPFEAKGNDELHEIAGGDWGKHLFILLKQEVQREHGTKGLDELDRRYQQQEHYLDLRKIKSVSKTSFADGNTHRDISKLASVFFSDLLPSDTGPTLIRMIRAFSIIVTIVHMKIIDELRLQQFDEVLRELGEATNEFIAIDIANFENKIVPPAQWYRSRPKDFEFSKWHALVHYREKIGRHGTPTHSDTRNGDGVHPQLKVEYRKTNKKEPLEQIATGYLRGLLYDRVEANVERSNNPDPLDKVPEANQVEIVAATNPQAPLLSEPSDEDVPVEFYNCSIGPDQRPFSLFADQLAMFFHDHVKRRGLPVARQTLQSDLPRVKDYRVTRFKRLDLTWFDSNLFAYNTSILRAAFERQDAVVFLRQKTLYIGKILSIFEIVPNSEFPPQDIVLVEVLERKQTRSFNGYIELTPRPQFRPVFFHIEEILQPVLIQEVQVRVEVPPPMDKKKKKKMQKGKGRPKKKEEENESEEEDAKKKVKKFYKTEKQFFLNDTIDVDILDLFHKV